MKSVRWYPLLSQYLKILEQLQEGVSLNSSRELGALEKMGLIKYFELAHELAMKVLAAYFRDQGKRRDQSPEEITREAQLTGLIPKGQGWPEMIRAHEDARHAYDAQIVPELFDNTCDSYYPLLKKFGQKMQGLRTGEQSGLF